MDEALRNYPLPTWQGFSVRSLSVRRILFYSSGKSSVTLIVRTARADAFVFTLQGEK